MTTRGERNNNPGNIDWHPSTIWEGELPHDPAIEARFCRFSDVTYGIRAIEKIILSYHARGLVTVTQIISTWAPGIENNTASYIDDVAHRIGVSADDEIDVDDLDYALPLVKAIILHENGECPYSDATITQGIQMALGG